MRLDQPLQLPQANPEILAPGDGSVLVVARPHPIRAERVCRLFDAGQTVAELVAEIQPVPVLRRHAHVLIEGSVIPRAFWPSVRPKPGTTVAIRMVPTGGFFGGGGGGGGKSPFSVILSIASFAAFFIPVVGPFISFGLKLVGGILSAVLAKQPKPKLPQLSGDRSSGGDTRDSPTTFLTGSRNDARPFGVIPQPLGQHRMTPPLGALTYTEMVGDDQFLLVLVNWGEGPLAIGDLKIRETPLTEFEDVEVITRQGFPTDDPLSLFTNDIFEEPLEVELRNDSGWQTRTSQLDAVELSVDITFPRGLVQFSSQAKKKDRTVEVSVQYAPAGSGAWVAAGTISATARRTNAVRRGLRWSVTEGQYDVRLLRTTPDSTSSQVLDETFWTALRTIKAAAPIDYDNPLATTELRIKSTGQQRVVDELNGVVTSICLDWDSGTQTWIERATRNPASLFRHVLQGKANRRPAADDEIDLIQLQAWHEFCEAGSRTFDMVIDFSSTVAETLADIAAAGRAVLDFRDNKWSVAIDQEKTVPVQHFTPDNSWGFRGEKLDAEKPHAWRVRFINQEIGWRQDERFVYRDGFNEANATKIEGLEFPGKTHPDAIWQDGRWRWAEASARPELYSFHCDVEHMVCNIGDLIHLTHDVIFVGLGSGRVEEVLTDAGNVTGYILNKPVEMELGTSYSLAFRLADGTSLVRSIVTDAGEQSVVTVTASYPVAQGPAAGDLFGFGEPDLEVLEALVTEIEPGPNLSARIACIPAANHIHQSDLEIIPPFVSKVATPPILLAPAVTGVRSDGTVLIVEPDGTFTSRILVTFRQPSALQPEIVGVEARYREAASDGSWLVIPQVTVDAGEISLQPVTEGETYDFQLRYGLETGTRSDWSAVQQHLVQGRADAPPKPDLVDVEVLADGTRSLTAELTNMPADVRASGGFRFRYAIGASADWATMTPMHDGLIVSTPWETNQLAAGTYTIAAKTIDSAGVESLEAVFITKFLTDPPLREKLLVRFEHELGWPGTLTNAYRYGTGLRATAAQTIGDLPATIDALAPTIVGMVPRNTVLTYRTPELDIGAVTTFKPLLSVEATGGVVFRQRAGDTSPLAGAFGALETVTARYVQFEVEVTDATAPALASLQILLDGETIVWDRNNVDPLTETGAWFSRLGPGNYKVAPIGMSAISQARLDPLNFTTPGWNTTPVDKAADLNGNLAVEFKTWDPSNVLADPPLFDVTVKGPRP